MLRKIFSIAVFLLFMTAIPSCSKDNPELPSEELTDEHEYVDLGLPSGVKWATCNVGASTPDEYGDYFAWGEIHPKSSYNGDNSITTGKKIGDIAGNPEYDAARANWGGSWRLPTCTELLELRNKCTWIWTTLESHSGYKVTGPNGNYIFLPAAGFRSGTLDYYVGSNGLYWSSDPYSDSNQASGLSFGSNGYYIYGLFRNDGVSIRPVTE